MPGHDMSPYMVEIIRSNIDNQDPPPYNMDRFVRIKHIESGRTDIEIIGNIHDKEE